MNRENEQYRDIAIKSLAVLGLMTILALGSYLTLTVLTYVPKAVRAVGSFVASTTPDVSTAVVNATNIARGDLGFRSNRTALQSGSAVTLFWDKSSANAGGSYALTYPCTSGVSVTYKGASLSCNVPFYLNQDAEEIALTVNSKKMRNAEIPFTLRFTKNGEDRIYSSDSATVAVTNSSIASATDSSDNEGNGSVTHKPTKTVVVTQTPFYNISSFVAGTPTYTNYFIPVQTTSYVPTTGAEWGQADLRPVILDVGITDPNTRAFISTRYMSRTSKATIRFAVENVGTKTSDPWVFNAVLPTSPRFTYLPEFQPPLRPGERIEYTLSFDRVVEDANSIIVTVDPAGTLEEATKANNSVTATFTAF